MGTISGQTNFPFVMSLALQIFTEGMFERHFCMAWPLLDLFETQMTVCQVKSRVFEKLEETGNSSLFK